MKTKLLKKVRKRYEIILVTKVNDLSLWHCEWKLELPYYILIDNYEDYRSSVCKDLKELKGELVKWIKNDYFKVSKKKPMIYKKVWHVNS